MSNPRRGVILGFALLLAGLAFLAWTFASPSLERRRNAKKIYSAADAAFPDLVWRKPITGYLMGQFAHENGMSFGIDLLRSPSNPGLAGQELITVNGSRFRTAWMMKQPAVVNGRDIPGGVLVSIEVATNSPTVSIISLPKEPFDADLTDKWLHERVRRFLEEFEKRRD